MARSACCDADTAPEREQDAVGRQRAAGVPAEPRRHVFGERVARALPAPGAGPRSVGRMFLFEIALASVVFGIYRSGRVLTRDATDVAVENAERVLAFERAIGIFTEQSVQQWALGIDGAIEFLNRYYVLVHFPATVAFLVWALVRRPDSYRHVRTWFTSVTLAALVIHVAFPLAPPRMTDGFIDTLREFGPSIYSEDTTQSVVNQFAAMPSLHVGWALMVAIGIVWLVPRRLASIAFVHPAVTLLAVVATGNHFWLDAVIAVALVVAAGLWMRRRARLDPAVCGMSPS